MNPDCSHKHPGTCLGPTCFVRMSPAVQLPLLWVLHLQGPVPSFRESAGLWGNFCTPAMWLQLPHRRRPQILRPNGCSGRGCVDRLPVKTDPKPRCFQLLGHTRTCDKTVHSSLLHIRFTCNFLHFSMTNDQFQPFILKGICNLLLDID